MSDRKQDLWEVAVTATTVQEVLDVAEGLDSDEVVTALACSHRYDLLEQLRGHEVYGADAEKELDVHQRLEAMQQAFESQAALYPNQLKRFRRIVKASPKVGIFDICYPSKQAAAAGLGDNFFAVSGDGLFMFMLEVVTTEGAGQYKLHCNPTGHGPGNDEEQFLEATGGQYERPLTADMVAEALMQIYNVQEEPK
jgi:hypothetical protein